MKKILVLLVLLLLVYQTASALTVPSWSGYSCNDPTRYTDIVWPNPPEEVIPFDSENPGLLFVNSRSGGILEFSEWIYLGEFMGVHRWRAFYNAPDVYYYLSGYVQSENGGAYGPAHLVPACEPNIQATLYLPLVINH